MSKLKLWGQPRSYNVQKVLWSLEELGLPYERVDAGGSFGKLNEPAYLALNPNGLIPTLEDAGTALWESNAILRYLFATYGSAPLHPADPKARARADGWNEWAAGTFWPHVRNLLVQLVRTPENARNTVLIETSQKQVVDALAILNGQLQKQPFVAGPDFTWGDIPLAAAAQRWFNLPLKRPSAPAVERWYEQVKQRPGFKRWIDLPLA